MAQALIQLKHETPRMEVTLVQGNNEALLEDLRDGRLDVVVGRAPAGGGKEAFDFELLYSEHFAVVCGAQNPLPALQAGPCVFEDLIDLPWILPDGNTALRSNLELLFLSRCGRMPDDCIQAVGSPVLGLLVTQGHRVAAVPGWLAREQQRVGQMRILLARLPNISGPIGITRRAGEAESSQGLRFAEALRRACDAFLAGPADPESGSLLPNS